MDLFHTLTIEETFERLKTSSHGLTQEEVEKRLREFGKNELQEEKVSRFKILLRQFNTVLIYILFLASLVSIWIREWTDFFVINFIILVNGLLGFFQEMKAENAIAALKKMTESKNQVLRDGTYVSVRSSELVPGDLITLREGEMVTADIRLTASSGLMVDESSMTGESTPVIKDHTAVLSKENLPYELENMLFTGTAVVRGSGSGVVVATGTKTYLASIAEKIKERAPESSLTKALKTFSKRYVLLLLAIFILLGVVGFLQKRTFLELGYILLAGLVSAIPEGLPIVVTFVMVLGAISLSKRQTLLRYLPSVETLGSVTVIASDKTGTITQGKLIVKEVYAQDLKTLKNIAALCNDAHGERGDPLDVALCHWVAECEAIRGRSERLWIHPFDTHLMMMATANRIEKEELLLIKGAFEMVKEKAENSEEFVAPFNAFLEKGLRVIAFGKGKWEGNPDPASWRVQMVGLIGFLDPPKEGVREAVLSARKAGIHLLMITGDHPMTAKAIAHEVEIYRKGDQLLTGREIEALADENLLEAFTATTVLARILPEHKYRIVKLLQKADELVAVTGDGVNDVPALKAADIGIAMGGGAEVAKSASDMVITDNNLRIIIDAIRNARVIADNIRKVIYYLVSTSLQEVFLITFAIAFSFPLPLAAIQILWVNIVTDGVLDKAFPSIKEEGTVMERDPRRPEKQFFDTRQVVRITIFGLTMGLFSFFLYLYLLQTYSFIEASTISFTALVAAQWANGMQAQKEKEPFFKNLARSFSINPYIFLALGVAVLLQCMVLYLTPSLFHSVPLSLEQWRYPIFSFVIGFFVVEIRKWVEWFIFPSRNAF